jgi:hypothetical protein
MQKNRHSTKTYSIVRIMQYESDSYVSIKLYKIIHFIYYTFLCHKVITSYGFKSQDLFNMLLIIVGLNIVKYAQAWVESKCTLYSSQMENFIYICVESKTVLYPYVRNFIMIFGYYARDTTQLKSQ